MGIVKTAISIDADLFNQAEDVARAMKIPRSRLFTLAVEEFIHKYENQRLFDLINKAYEDEPDVSEFEPLRNMARTHRRIVKRE